MKKFITFLTTTALLLTLCACSAQNNNSALVDLADLADLTIIETVNSSAKPQPDTQNQDNSSGDEVRGDDVEGEDDNFNDDSDDWEDDFEYAHEGDFEYRSDGSGGVEIVKYIGKASELIIPGSIDGMPVTRIGDDAFYQGDFTSVIIPDSVTSIGELAFCYCEMLTSITIPDSVTSIGEWAFIFSGLTEIKVSTANQHYTDIDGVLFNKDLSTIIAYPPVKTGKYIIPDSVTSIGDGAFHYTGLTSVVIPNSVTSIGEWAFYASILTSIIIPNSVTSIEAGAFYGCEELTNITIPGSVKSIGYEAFAHSGLTSITIPDSVKSIGDVAFYGCPDLTIYGARGSYAEEYAYEHGIHGINFVANG